MSIYTVEEVSTHNSAQSCWIIIHGKVYDVTKFLVLHPGGRNVLLKVAGKDASKEFTTFHSKDVLAKYLKLCIGSLKDSKEIPKEVIHYAEGSKWQGFNSIYYKESHRKFRTAVREFVDKELMPYVSEWEEAREVPVEIRKKCGQAGMLCGFVSEWRKEYAPVGIPGGVKPEEYDMFHEFILVEEFSRLASFGVVGNIFVTMSIALPPILNFGSKFLKDKVARECLMGDKQICLCISEPQAGRYAFIVLT
jgi:predicted heme/steroid binding protein